MSQSFLHVLHVLLALCWLHQWSLCDDSSSNDILSSSTDDKTPPATPAEITTILPRPIDTNRKSVSDEDCREPGSQPDDSGIFIGPFLIGRGMEVNTDDGKIESDPRFGCECESATQRFYRPIDFRFDINDLVFRKNLILGRYTCPNAEDVCVETEDGRMLRGAPDQPLDIQPVPFCTARSLLGPGAVGVATVQRWRRDSPNRFSAFAELLIDTVNNPTIPSPPANSSNNAGGSISSFELEKSDDHPTSLADMENECGIFLTVAPSYKVKDKIAQAVKNGNMTYLLETFKWRLVQVNDSTVFTSYYEQALVSVTRDRRLRYRYADYAFDRLRAISCNGCREPVRACNSKDDGL